MTPTAPTRTARLRSLLSRRGPGDQQLFAPASREALVEAHALGPELAAQAVTAMLDGYVEGRDPATGERAVDLALQLRLTGAIPALVSCLERLSEYDPVANAALRALGGMKADATGPLLAAFGRCTTPEGRAWIGRALLGAPQDERVRAAFVSMLADDPVSGAGYLSEHGDRAALPHLSATLDRLELAGVGADELRRCEEIVAVAQAIRTLRGAFTASQRAKFEHAWARSEDLLLGGPAVHEPEDGGSPVHVVVGANAALESTEGRSAEELSARIDEVLDHPVDDCDICAGERLTTLELALFAAGGTPTREQRARIDDVRERAASMWLPGPDLLRLPPRRAARPRAGRNEPCPCGSGKKYKRCHLDADVGVPEIL